MTRRRIFVVCLNISNKNKIIKKYYLLISFFKFSHKSFITFNRFISIFTISRVWATVAVKCLLLYHAYSKEHIEIRIERVWNCQSNFPVLRQCMFAYFFPHLAWIFPFYPFLPKTRCKALDSELGGCVWVWMSGWCVCVWVGQSVSCLANSPTPHPHPQDRRSSWNIYIFLKVGKCCCCRMSICNILCPVIDLIHKF